MPYPKGATKKQKSAYRRCVKKVKRKGKVRSPYAVCQASVFKRKKRKKKRR